MKRVIILLSSYNGEAFIEEQLQSLTAQTGVTTSIIVRDDGSTDGTRDILDRWQESGTLTWYGGDNIGWADSFMHLLVHAPEADYYAFCDQDDIWMPDKLKVAVEHLERHPDTPSLYCSNLLRYQNGKDEGLLLPQQLHYDIHTAMMKCLTTGCTMVLNKPLADAVRQHAPRHTKAHDFWVYQVAMAIGQVDYDPIPHIHYRLHEANQVGYKISFTEVWRRRLQILRRRQRQYDREEAAAELLRCYADQMSETNREAVSQVANYRKSIAQRLRLVTDGRYTMGNIENDFWLKLRILLGKL